MAGLSRAKDSNASRSSPSTSIVCQLRGIAIS
jgi:hypothetical protein